MAQEKIEIRANPVAGGLASHLYIVYTDKNGNEYYARGGPGGDGPGSSRSSGELSGGSSNNSGSSGSRSSNPSRSSDSSSGDSPYGNIVTDHGSYEPGTIDWNPDPNQPRRVVAQGDDLRATYDNIVVQVDRIEAAGIRYNPISQNSNSTVTTALRNVGIQPTLPEGIRAPGDGTQLIDGIGRRLVSSLPNENTVTAQVFNDAFYNYFNTNPISQQTVPLALQQAGTEAYEFDQTVTNDQLQAMSDSLMRDFLQRDQQLTA